jgi:uncharacterized membrane protein YdcZ (DUF606 family)
MGVAAKLNYLKSGISATLSFFSNLLLGILLALFFGQDQPDSKTSLGQLPWWYW